MTDDFLDVDAHVKKMAKRAGQKNIKTNIGKTNIMTTTPSKGDSAFKAFLKNPYGKAAVIGTAIGIPIKAALVYGAYKVGKSSDRKEPKKYMKG